jgi:Ca-activated chloride channel family protein
MNFVHIYAFYIILLLGILIFISGKIKDYERYFSPEMLNKIIVGKSQKKIRFGLLIASFLFIIIALARPVIQNKPIKVPQSSINIVVAFDISKSMLCTDVYPNRLQFAKTKFNDLLSNLKDEKVGVIGFSSRAFLVAPITNDYNTLKYLVSHIDLNYINVHGSSIQEALQSTNNLLDGSQKKALIIFTDGTDKHNFKDEINYAKEHNIKVFIYAIATKKGGVIKTQNGVQKDKNGNIVITRLNNDIKQLAFGTNGAYLEYSTSKNDIVKFVDAIKDKFKQKQKKAVVIKNNEELYYFPLIIALLLFILATSSFKGIRR